MASSETEAELIRVNRNLNAELRAKEEKIQALEARLKMARAAAHGASNLVDELVRLTEA